MKAKYGDIMAIETLNCPTEASPFWKGIYTAYLVLKLHLKWWVGDDKSINVNSSLWDKPITNYHGIRKVSDLIDQNSNWNMDKLRALYDGETVTQIMNLPISRHGSQMKL